MLKVPPVFRPLLCPHESPQNFPSFFEKLPYPLLCSPKYDGVRCLVRNGMALSRTGKILPSLQVQEEFWRFEYFDGELIVGHPTDELVYNTTQSHVMSHDKPGDLHFYVFDYVHPDYLEAPFHERVELLRSIFPTNTPEMVFVEHEYIDSQDELLAYEEKCLKEGYEGVIMRNPVAPYKQGRATFRQSIIYRLKRFMDDEAVIVGFEERMENVNVQEKDELGYAKRSSAKEGMIPAGTLGKFIVQYRDDELKVSPGTFTHDELQFIWNNQEQFIGAHLKFRFFSYGIKDKPRFPRAIGIRDEGDVLWE
jgi:DNA ligase 1